MKNVLEKDLVRRVFSCIDHTTLKGTDNEESVEQFCRDTLEMCVGKEGAKVAAVCVYPRFVGIAKKLLDGSSVRVASVAGGFPHGQTPLEVKLAEVRYAVENGADEIDMVISRGLLLSGEDNKVCDEVASIKEACSGSLLKVIIETGELPSFALVEKASMLAMEGGADFIKTSTGKIPTGATLEAAEVMLRCINNNVKNNKKTVGFKASGGIRTVEQAEAYAQLAKKIMGDDYINNQTFRIGASSLTQAMYSFLTL